MGICYLVGAGDFPFPFSPMPDDFVIAADGGYDHLRKNGIRCDLLVGDLDSLSDLSFAGETVRFPVEKDETDMYLAYREGVKRGYTDFAIYGAGGGREDHTFANYCLLYAIKTEGNDAYMAQTFGDVYILKDEERTFSGTGKEGKHLSALPFMGVCRGVSVRGLCYRAENVTVKPEFPYTVSNLFVGKDAQIAVKDGTLLVMIER